MQKWREMNIRTSNYKIEWEALCGRGEKHQQKTGQSAKGWWFIALARIQMVIRDCFYSEQQVRPTITTRVTPRHAPCRTTSRSISITDWKYWQGMMSKSTVEKNDASFWWIKKKPEWSILPEQSPPPYESGKWARLRPLHARQIIKYYAICLYLVLGNVKAVWVRAAEPGQYEIVDPTSRFRSTCRRKSPRRSLSRSASRHGMGDTCSRSDAGR